MAVDGREPDAGDYSRVRDGLNLLLLARFRTLGPDEICEIGDEALVRLLRESRRQTKALDEAGAWLIRVGGNLARDRLKKLDPTPLLNEDRVADDQATRMLERLADKDHVDSAMGTAIREGDDVAVCVIRDWLDLYGETKKAPSSRTVAQHCGYSHRTVQMALRRFGGYLT